jgi:hypothetical protein
LKEEQWDADFFPPLNDMEAGLQSGRQLRGWLDKWMAVLRGVTAAGSRSGGARLTVRGQAPGQIITMLGV